jgi:hypothetical protein
MTERCNHVVVISSRGRCRDAMAPKGHGVGYRKSNSLRKAPGGRGFTNYHREEGIERKGRRNERERFWMSLMLECEAETEGEFSLVVAPRGANRSSTP